MSNMKNLLGDMDFEEFEKLRDKNDGTNVTYRNFKVEYKSKNGDTYDLTVSTVDMIAAYEMVEDTFEEDEYEITSITRV